MDNHRYKRLTFAERRLGELPLDHYERDGPLDHGELLADLMSLCEKFNTDFDAGLEEARRNRLKEANADNLPDSFFKSDGEVTR